MLGPTGLKRIKEKELEVVWEQFSWPMYLHIVVSSKWDSLLRNRLATTTRIFEENNSPMGRVLFRSSPN